LIVDD
jgi:CheY-like chemotaxis protein